MPQGIYLRAYLKVYARELGLDVAQVLREYDDEQAPVNDTPVHPPSGHERVAVSGTSTPLLSRLELQGFKFDGRVLSRAAAVPGVLLLFVLATYLFPPASPDAPGGARVVSDSTVPVPAEPPAAASVATASNGRTAPPSTPSTAPATAGASPVQVTLSAKNRVWVTAYADGTRVLYRLLRPGEDVTLTARKTLRVRTGDAGALAYSIDGGATQPAGGAGQVRDMSLTREDGRVALR